MRHGPRWISATAATGAPRSTAVGEVLIRSRGLAEHGNAACWRRVFVFVGIFSYGDHHLTLGFSDDVAKAALHAIESYN